jgi:hypothetical protein
MIITDEAQKRKHEQTFISTTIQAPQSGCGAL